MDEPQVTPADTGAAEPVGSVAETFNQVFAQPSEPSEPPAASEPPDTITQSAEPESQVDESQAQADAGDDLPDFTLDDPAPTLERLYTDDELAQLAQSNPEQAWEYAIQANAYLQQNLQTIREIQQAAEGVGSTDALLTLGELGAALFQPGEATPATVYQSLLKLHEAYPDPDSGPMNQIAKAMVTYRAPEMLAEMGDQLPAFLAGNHPYLDLATYQPQSETDRYQAQKYIDQLNQQRTAMLEALAPAVYEHFGNKFDLRDQYKLVGPEGEFFGLADNTIDKDIRFGLPDELRPIYDQLSPGIRGRLNMATRDELVDNLTQRKVAADAQARLAEVEKQNAEQVQKINERIEQQQREQADTRAAQWETGVEQYVASRLTDTYKLGAYPAQVIQMQLKHHMQTDPAAKQIYEKCKEAAKAGNGPLLARLEGDLSRKAEVAIRQYLGEWQKATGQRVTRSTAAPAQQPPRKVVPLYSGARPSSGNGRDDGGYGSVADEFAEAFKNISPYVGN